MASDGIPQEHLERLEAALEVRDRDLLVALCAYAVAPGPK